MPVIPPLLPCPFCGSTDIHAFEAIGDGFHRWGAYCRTCQATGPHSFAGPALAAALWNSRGNAQDPGQKLTGYSNPFARQPPDLSMHEREMEKLLEKFFERRDADG